MTKTTKLNKRDIHLLLCLRLVTGVAKSPMGAKVLIPIKGKVNVSSVYESLNKFIKIELVNKYNLNEYAGGGYSTYGFTDIGLESVKQFKAHYDKYYNYFTAPPETPEEKARKFRERYEAAVRRVEETKIIQ